MRVLSGAPALWSPSSAGRTLSPVDTIMHPSSSLAPEEAGLCLTNHNPGGLPQRTGSTVASARFLEGTPGFSLPGNTLRLCRPRICILYLRCCDFQENFTKVFFCMLNKGRLSSPEDFFVVK